MAETNPPSPSEESFRKGLAALERRNYIESTSFLQAAIDLERQEGAKNPRMKYVSYLGLALTLTGSRSEEGVRLCEQAVKRDFFNPDLFCNLGIVYLRTRQKKRAFQAFQKGLNLKPGHQRIRDELDRYERRGLPVFSFLPRQHLVNRLAGRLRHRLRVLFNRAAANQV